VLAVALLALLAVLGACTDQTESLSSSGLTKVRPTSTTTVPRAPTTVVTPVTSALPPLTDGSHWKPILNDGFGGTTLDASHWATCYYWSATTCTNASTHELELYTPRGVSLSDGELHLTARHEPATADDGTHFDYTSGMISSARPDRTMFSFRYGYVETRARIPAGAGFWAAFWLLPTSRLSLPEVDVFEIVGYQPNVVLEFTHWLAASGKQQFGNAAALSASVGAWHVYGLDWEPSSLTWYVDGRKVWTMNAPGAVPQQDMMLIADLAVGGPYATAPSAATAFPSAMRVDYVKVWQH